MIEGARQLPVHHLTVRVPWHDSKWNGSICKNPCNNTSCTILKRISSNRDDAIETSIAGESIQGLTQDRYPPCIQEHATIMAPFSQSMTKLHPYSEKAEETHGHFDATPYTIPAYSAAVVPFRWMLREQIEGNARNNIPSKVDDLRFDYQEEREPDLSQNKGWKKDKKTWIQEGVNQRVILDTFSSAIKPNVSLVFFYAKRTPLLDDARRVIIGVGRIKTIGELTEYLYKSGKRPANKISGYLWERNIEHSIRPDSGEGFLLPYSELLELSEKDDNVNIGECVAFSPDDYFEQYSYGSELISQDGAIASLLSIEKAIKHIRVHLDGPWEQYFGWIDKELNRLWYARGAFPGIGAALNAFGIPHGNLLAWYLTGDVEKPIDIWKKFASVLEKPESLPEYLRDGLGEIQKAKWEKLPDDRRKLLMLLSRFCLSNDQATRWYQGTERSRAGISIDDSAILVNPYLIYELDRYQVDPIAFSIVDRGMFPPKSLRELHPLPEPSAIHEAIDKRRVRALIIQALEAAASEGHTILPEDWLINRIRDEPLQPDCPIDADTLNVIIQYLEPVIFRIKDESGKHYYQLGNYVEIGKTILETIEKRIKGASHTGEYAWIDLVNSAIDGEKRIVKISSEDEKARREKAAALSEIYRSRISVLVGSAGTGKSTLLKALCSIDDVNRGGILILAPTGKARVRLEYTTGLSGQGKTIAQFLLGLKRYDGNTGRYFLNHDAPRASAHKTVIIDECSMLTEEQLAALFDALKGVERYVLVGDPKQLPPIGAGRPYVDIVNRLKPDRINISFPRVASNYAELTISMRQQQFNENVRTDVLLASMFCGNALDAGADEVWSEVKNEATEYITLRRWDKPEQLHAMLKKEIVSHLSIDSEDDEIGFETILGANVSEYNEKTNVFFNNRYGDRAGAAEKIEDWQILSPIRSGQIGVLAINRLIQKQFRKKTIEMANVSGFSRVIPNPMGPEEIIYGDKVINIRNKGDRYVFPKKDDSYVANGDIGVVVGHRKTKARNHFPVDVEVEYASQPGFTYQYKKWEFDGQESTPPLELAYALTVHKTQGSEFGICFLIIPNPCRVLSRELLYTALTRHKDKLIILHQGDFSCLESYSSDSYSEIARRMTNLFSQSRPVEVRVKNRSIFLDENLIYRTSRGELVRSKSEWIIADKLNHAGIDYQYEQPIKLSGVERYPDFTIVDDDSGIRWYWEHNGMMDNPQYRERWQRKLDAYRKNDILPLSEGRGKNGTLLITEEGKGSGLAVSDIQNNINIILGKKS